MPSASYTVSYSEAALEYLATLPPKLRRQIAGKIDRLTGNTRPPGCKLVQGVSDGDQPVYRIRQGNYRALYVVRDTTVVILDIDHRKDVYR
jgi:mRNA-degrading endonuclease RelE of RelBE toxin-antitoxin system